MKKVYIDSTKIHDNEGNSGFYIQDAIEGLEMPSLRLSNFERPASDGAFVSNQLYGARVISFSGLVIGDDIDDYRSKRNTITTSFSIRRVNQALRNRVLKFETLDGSKLQVDCYVRSFEFSDLNLTHGRYRVNLYCPDFKLESQTNNTQNIFLFSGGGFAVPFDVPFDMSTGGSTTDTLSNDGNIESFIDITLNGPLTNPTIDNLTTDDQLSVTYTLSSTSERIEIDTKSRTALYFSSPSATGTNILGSISGDWLFLEAGDNEIKLTNSSYNTDAFANFRWSDSYIGI